MSTYLGGSGVGQGANTATNMSNTASSSSASSASTGSVGDLLTDWGGEIIDFVVGDSGILSKMGDPEDQVGQLLNLGVASYLSKSMQPNRPEVGYQGEIPKYTKVRQRVEQPTASTEGKRTGILTANPEIERTRINPEYDPVTNPDVPERIDRSPEDVANKIFSGDRYQRNYERRPGGRGRRYFTDTQYAKTPEGDLEPPTLEEAEAKAAAQAAELKEQNALNTNFAAGGLASMQSGQLFNNGYYLGGKTDGMADKVPARIDGKQEARLSDGEFVIPADVVSHLGNGNSDAGAQQLHSMMDGVRTARTGNPEQGKQIDPQQFMPKFAQGGIAKFDEGGDVATETPVGQEVGSSGALANWAGEYVSDMLGRGKAEADAGYEAYTGPLTAGTSTLQDQGMTGISQLNNPVSGRSIVNQMGSFDPTQADTDRFMNPYEQNVIDRTAADMTRQDQINQLQQQQQLTSAGAFGGSRDALLRAEAASNLNRNIGDMAAQQRATGFTNAMDRAQQRQQDINKYGFDVLGAQMNAGQTARGIMSEGIAADYEQFREERDYDAKMVQYMQSLLQGLPVAARTTSYTEPSALGELIQGQEGLNYLLDLFGYEQNQTNIGTE
tara:strand:+ start:1123 stop:2955 length:1833 start_codon:yes stop_codon:yes gene_type:complete